MSDAYDDRIFALSSIVASVLVYNLPETVKEGDIEKLSFALELAREFSGRAAGANGRVGAGGFEDASAEGSSSSYDDGDDDLGRWDASQLRAFLPDSLLWLIQRDFLEGSTVTDMVDQALRGVANPTKDAHVAELNRIRASLRALAANHDAFGLTQPHLERTRLCELRDDQLEPGYVEQREKLKAHVRASAVAKPSIGAALASGFETASNERFRETPDARRESAELAMTGVELAALIERSVAALHEGDFPTAGSVVDAFNRDAMERRVEAYERALNAVALPAEAEALRGAHAGAKKAQISLFRAERFGRGAVTARALAQKLDALFDLARERNAFASGKACDALASACEETLVKMSNMRLPSLRKFDATANRACARAFAEGCVGPSLDTARARVTRAVERERAAFAQTYNARLLNGLLLIAVGGVVMFRFLYVAPLAELRVVGAVPAPGGGAQVLLHRRSERRGHVRERVVGHRVARVGSRGVQPRAGHGRRGAHLRRRARRLRGVGSPAALRALGARALPVLRAVLLPPPARGEERGAAAEPVRAQDRPREGPGRVRVRPMGETAKRVSIARRPSARSAVFYVLFRVYRLRRRAS